MRCNTRNALITVCLIAASAIGVAEAQTRTERERQQMETAQERARAAQAELQRALELMDEAEESEEARERLDDAIRELQRARSSLGRDRLISGYAGPRDLLVTSRRRGPQMGVYLNTERKSATDSIGAVVNRVTEDGPAYEAGLRNGDIVTVANGETLAREQRRGTSPANKLIQIKDELEEGDTLHVEYRRGATTHSADIELRYLDELSVTVDNFGLAREFATPDITVVRGDRGDYNVATVFAGELSSLGMLDAELIELDEELGWYFGVEQGLLVVRPPSDDEVIDLRSGDVIVSIDGRQPNSEAQLMRILRSYAEGETMEISIKRQREPLTMDVTVPERDGSLFWRRDGAYW